MRMRSNANAVLLAALTAVPVVSRAATVTLTASDAAAASSFSAAGNWSNAAAPSAANDYVVGPNLTLRTPAAQATNLTFAGNSLTLGDAAVLALQGTTGLTTTVNNFTLNGGQVTNNTTAATSTLTLAGNVTLGAAGGTFTTVGGRVLNVTASIAGAGPLTVNTGLNTLTLGGANTSTGVTTITGSAFNSDGLFGAVRATDGTNLSSAGNLFLNSGVLETGVNITRAVGSGAGQVRLGGATSGFSAVAANVTVALGGVADPFQLNWGSSTFNPQNFVLNNTNATHTLTLANAIDLGFATRTIVNNGAATSSAILAGGLSSETATSGVNFYGRGTTVLPTGNAFTGAVTIGNTGGGSAAALNGVVRATASGALGTGLVTIGLGGNGANGRLELANNITLPNAISLPVRTSPTVGVQNLSGNNTLANTVTIGSGGTYAIFQSDSGTLTLSGAFGAGGTAITSSAGNTRYVTLQGAGNGLISGVVTNVAGTSVAVAKAGVGTWTLGNAANAYVGPTALLDGTLATSSLANGGAASGIGASTNVAAGLVLNGGTLRYTGGATASDKLFTVGAAGGTINASGTGPMTLTNPAANLTADPATNGTFSSGGTTVTVTAGLIAGVAVGQTVTGTGIRANTTVAAVNYIANTFTLSQTTTAAGTGAVLTLGASPTRTLTLTGTNAANNAVTGTLANSAGGRVLAVAKSGPGTWVLGGANTYAGATTITDGTLKATVASGAAGNLLTNAGGVNLGDSAGRLVLDYTSSGTSPVASVKSILTGQYATAGNSTAGFLAGRIRSTGLTANHTIGYADTGTGLVTLHVTLPGDADLDGDVDFSDFTAVLTSFGVADTRFDQGNFNYDAVTDFNDFTALQLNFGQTIGFGVPRPTVTVEQVAAVTAFGLANAVPEPACVATLAFGVLVCGRRRRVTAS